MELTGILREGQMRPHMVMEEDGTMTVEHYGRMMRQVLEEERERLQKEGEGNAN
jgi:hypothetical protein